MSTSLADRWTRAWFQPASAADLALCRIAWCALCLLHLGTQGLGARIDGFDAHAYEPLPILGLLAAPFGGARALGPDTLRALLAVSESAGLLALLGCATRITLPIFALGSLLLQAWAYSFGSFGHEISIALWGLLLLCCVPSGAAWSIDAWIGRRAGRGAPSDRPIDGAGWPIRCVHVLLALAYLSAGASKLVRDPGAWLGGWTLQYYVSFHALRSQSQAGLWLMRQHAALVVLAWLLVAFEASFVLSLWLRGWSRAWLVGSMLVHAGAMLCMGVYFPSFPVLCFTVLPWRTGAATTRAVSTLTAFDGPPEAHRVRSGRAVESRVGDPCEARGRAQAMPAGIKEPT